MSTYTLHFEWPSGVLPAGAASHRLDASHIAAARLEAAMMYARAESPLGAPTGFAIREDGVGEIYRYPESSPAGPI